MKKVLQELGIHDMKGVMEYVGYAALVCGLVLVVLSRTAGYIDPPMIWKSVGVGVGAFVLFVAAVLAFCRVFLRDAE